MAFIKIPFHLRMNFAEKIQIVYRND